ncbi:uncharacterized protein LOC134548442 [Prinia subflava]|uniref:uncharacterized protein LOC134548442 n=1 Tax=Prinia subflava TaxID=208062 RepID=UPI002FE0F881
MRGWRWIPCWAVPIVFPGLGSREKGSPFLCCCFQTCPAGTMWLCPFPGVLHSRMDLGGQSCQRALTVAVPAGTATAASVSSLKGLVSCVQTFHKELSLFQGPGATCWTWTLVCSSFWTVVVHFSAAPPHLAALNQENEEGRTSHSQGLGDRTMGNGLKLPRAGLDGILGIRNCSLGGRGGAGLEFPEQLWLPLHPWQCPRPGWTLGLEQPGTVGGVPAHVFCWNWMIFKVPLNPTHSVLLMSLPEPLWAASGVTILSWSPWGRDTAVPTTPNDSSGVQCHPLLMEPHRAAAASPGWVQGPGGAAALGCPLQVPTGPRSARSVPCRVLEPRMGDVERPMLAEGSSLLHLVQEFIGKSSRVCKSKWLETSGADTVRTFWL